MEELPCALFSSSSTACSPDDLVLELLQVSKLPEAHVFDVAIKGYKWSFETKYYSTTIHLCTTTERTIGSQEFADNLQAFIHYFDPNEPATFDLTKAWLPYLEHIEPSVLMLVCDTSKHTDAISRKVVLEWCISHGFELVELKPEQDDDTDEEDEFAETTGLARIIQALHAHTWPNMDLKENPTIQSPYVRQLMKEQQLENQEEDQEALKNDQSSHSANPSEDNDNEKGVTEQSENKTCGIVDVGHSNGNSDSKPTNTLPADEIDWTGFVGADGDMDSGDLDVEEFEQLFKNLKVMKDKAETLPFEERKKYAEQVAVSFWKAIGGDENEVDGVGDSD